MLRSLTIRNVVLIEKLDLSFAGGLGVLTGETGSGKSILLDALGLALGARAGGDLVRTGADQGSAIAEFEFDPGAYPDIEHLLEENDLADDSSLVLRRSVTAGGRSRAFINDRPVSVTMLRSVGKALVEFTGQLESHSLLDSNNHASYVDAYRGAHKPVTATATAHAAWRDAGKALAEAKEEMARAQRDEEFLRHAATELAELNPKPGEEEVLASTRNAQMHRQQLQEALNGATADLLGDDATENSLRAAMQKLESTNQVAGGRFDAALNALERALIELNEAQGEIVQASAGLELDPSAMEQAEERLFALRTLARKHNVTVDELQSVRDDLKAKLSVLEDSAENLDRLERETEEARGAYIAAANDLARARNKAASALEKAVEIEFPNLKLEKARFKVRFEELEEADWGPGGNQRLSFEVQTNTNTNPGPIARVASGGELARIMLAIKVVLAGTGSVPTVVFDEVDSGIGGAAAAAVGERLARLAEKFQVLVVTHSPQVAARGDKHWRITKEHDNKASATLIDNLDGGGRIEEIARMLAGARVTDEARAAAKSLIEDATSG
ncbi:MAG: DNA repair protein RecN [Pseudomonadota bacterium]|nr:DNA repair protein RecN [Pseudomonadota bacterium]